MFPWTPKIDKQLGKKVEGLNWMEEINLWTILDISRLILYEKIIVNSENAKNLQLLIS